MPKNKSITTESELSGLSVLVVDDLDANLFAMEKMLEVLNVNIITASSADEGLRVLLQRKVDVVLLDYSMPVMNGLEMAQIIHQQFKEPPPILFITAHGRTVKELEQACYEIGAIDFMEKPVKKHILLAKLKVLISLSVQKERLRAMATTDSLTKLKNRLAFTEALNYSMALSKRQNNSIALLALDLDGFKDVNDKYGHDAGDCLLVEFARRIESCIRESDIAARMGGDEFSILLTNLNSEEEAVWVARKILAACEKEFTYESNTLLIKTSIGIALRPQNADNNTALVRAADQALYQAKSNGKSQFYVFDSESSEKFNADEVESMINCKLLPIYDSKSENRILGHSVVPYLSSSEKFASYQALFDLATKSGNLEVLDRLFSAAVIKSVRQLKEKFANSHQKLFYRYLCNEVIKPIHKQQIISLARELKTIGVELVIVLEQWRDIDNKILYKKELEALNSEGIQLCLGDIGHSSIPTGIISSANIDYIILTNDLANNIDKNHYSRTVVQCLVAISNALGCAVIVDCSLGSEEKVILQSLGCHYFVKQIKKNNHELAESLTTSVLSQATGRALG
ncbi:diguanylate cyclase domain-containing protein [Aliikangiella sp. IMCC44632]